MSATSVGEGRPQTLVRFVMSELRDANGTTNPSLDLAELVAAVQAAVKAVSAALRNAGLAKWHSARDMAADLFTKYLRSSYTTSLVICDHKEVPVEAGGDRRGKYVVCVSPLDADVESPDPPPVAGSIFGVYRCAEGRTPSSRWALQAGRNLVAAGYALYGSSTILVLSLGQGVHLFTLDPMIGELVLTSSNITIPPRGQTYSVDEGLTYEWGDPVVEYIETKKDPKLGTPYRSHHMGCVVADVHHVLRCGGIYLSPQTRSQPSGKLRLMLEAVPLAHIVCRAGGLSTDGHSSLLDCLPDGAAHRSAAFFGSREDVRDLLAMFRRHGLYSARPSSLRQAHPVTPSPSLDVNGQVRASERERDRERAAAVTGLSASVALLSASVAALGGVGPSRPVSATSGTMAGLTNQAPQRPVSAAGAISPISPGSSASGAAPSNMSSTLHPVVSALPHSLATKKLS